MRDSHGCATITPLYVAIVEHNFYVVEYLFQHYHLNRCCECRRVHCAAMLVGDDETTLPAAPRVANLLRVAVAARMGAKTVASTAATANALMTASAMTPGTWRSHVAAYLSSSSWPSSFARASPMSAWLCKWPKEGTLTWPKWCSAGREQARTYEQRIWRSCAATRMKHCALLQRLAGRPRILRLFAERYRLTTDDARMQ